MEEKVKLFFDKEIGHYRTFYKGVEIPVFAYEISQKSREHVPFAEARLSIEVEIVNEKPEPDIEIFSTNCGFFTRNTKTGEIISS